MIPVSPTLRFVATTATTLGVNKVLKEVVKNNVAPAITKLDSVQIKIGVGALSLATAAGAVAVVEEAWDRTAETIANLRKKSDPAS